MELYESIRVAQSAVIAKNPSSIVITRTTKTRGNDGGETESTSILSAQTVRIYSKKTRILDTNDSGLHIKRSIKMHCGYNADVLPEGQSSVDKTKSYLDRFTANSKNYKIKDVIDHTTQGQIVFKECWIEEVT